MGQAWIFFIEQLCLLFGILIFGCSFVSSLRVEVDADQELPSVSSFWHYMTSMIHDWNWVKKILWIFEDHLLVSVNISFQSLFTTCFSYEYTLNWIETLLYLQGISMYKSYKLKQMKPKKLLLSSSQLPLVFCVTVIHQLGWFQTLDGSTRPQARMELEVPKVAEKK